MPLTHLHRYMTPDPSTDEQLNQALSRSYARRISGVPTYMHFDRKTYEFVLSYTPSSDPSVFALPTEVYINQEYHYPKGALWTATPDGAVTAEFNSTSGLYYFTNTPSSMGQQVNITITPAN